MKMAEYDYELRNRRAGVRIIRLLQSTIVSVVEEGRMPPNFSNVQFAMFDIARETNASYAECREITEYAAEFLFAFYNIDVDVALKVFDIVSESVRDDLRPATIQNDVIKYLRGLTDLTKAERVAAAVANFIQQLVIDDEDDIVYR